MAAANEERCKELRDALADARSRLVPPQRETAVPGFQTVRSVDPGDTTPDGSPQLEQEIAQLEQALRDEGCEPD